MSPTRVLLATLVCVLPLPGLLAQSKPRFDRADAEHLLNRAGFGAPPAEIDRFVAMGRERAVLALLDGEEPTPADAPYLATAYERPDRQELRELSEDERREVQRKLRADNRRQMEDYTAAWLERMAGTSHPFREKMVLFWHGYFTSSFRDVRNSYHLIQQNELFRTHALGSFRLLLHEVSRDPAMLEYLDNRQNRKGSPNENFAREVMELFTLGVGNYTEKDIKEAARAFTGWTFVGNRFVFNRRAHDPTTKTILGRTGLFDGTDVLDILLDQPAAPRWVARKLLDAFVGPDLPDGMVDRYARLLRKHHWELRPFFLALFNDPDFYRSEVRGSRILSPVELVVGISRRLGETPPGSFLASTTSLLGQALFDPPNVKGWDGGEAWITTATFLHRGNFGKYLVEGVTPRKLRSDFMSDDGGAAMQMTGMGRAFRGLGARARWAPTSRIAPIVERAGARTPEEIVDVLADHFLAVPLTDEARKSLVSFVGEAGDGALNERRLKRLVGLILSLPEAQLG